MSGGKQFSVEGPRQAERPFSEAAEELAAAHVFVLLVVVAERALRKKGSAPLL